MRGGKRKSAGGVTGGSNFDPPPTNTDDYGGGYAEMPVSDAAAAVEEFKQQQQRQRKLEKGKEVQQVNEEDFEENGGDEYYGDGEEDGGRNIYDRFDQYDQDGGDGQADGGGDEEGGYDEEAAAADEEEEEEADERPKLAEGFYEIEAVRKKRTRKGVAQYLIKWRGWPETANTWEPLVNLQACTDVIEAFESNLQSGKGKSGRKRKRKNGVTPQTQSKKKQQQPSQQRKQQKHSPAADTYDVRAVRVTLMEDPITYAPMIDSLNAVAADVGAVTPGEAVKQGDENGTPVAPPQEEVRREMDLSSSKGSKFVNLDNPDDVSVQVEEQPAPEGAAHTNGVPSVDGNDASQTGRRIGARRRKSGAVKRFKPESTSHAVDNAQDATIRTSFANGVQNDGLEFTKPDTPVITEIIKAIEYSSSVSDNTQEVSVNFMAMRSDGLEVPVSNKYLKAHYPLLLINFYEKHLRYSTP